MTLLGRILNFSDSAVSTPFRSMLLLAPIRVMAIVAASPSLRWRCRPSFELLSLLRVLSSSAASGVPEALQYRSLLEHEDKALLEHEDISYKQGVQITITFRHPSAAIILREMH